MRRIFLTNARLVDGTGAPAVENGTLVMEVPQGMGKIGKILYSGAAKECSLVAAECDEVVDLTGYTILPGIFDCHVHLWLTSQKPLFKADHMGVAKRTLMYYRNAVDALINGVTTMRTVGGSDDIDIALRDAINKGYVWGSRIITCGPPIESHGAHCHITWGTVECSGPAEFAKAARTEIGKGVDQIKIMYTGGAGGGADEGMYTTYVLEEEAAMVCKVAHMTGHKVAAHLSNDYGIRSALRAGVDSVEHCYSMNEETAKMIAEKGAYFVPTMGVTGNAALNYEKNKSHLNEHFKRVMKRLMDAHPAHVEGFRYALKHGVKICVGTDGIPGMSADGMPLTLHEIVLLVESGMTPLEAIKAATYNSAELCSLEKKTGSLKEGLYADLTVYKGNPDEDIQNLRNLAMVAKEGRIVWSEVENFKKARCFEVLPQDGADPLAGLGNSW